MSEAYVNRLENGVVRNPKIKHLGAIARALDLPIDALVTRVATQAESLLAEAIERGGIESLLAGQPRLAIALASLASGLESADPEDREFVLGHLEALARRNVDQLPAMVGAELCVRPGGRKILGFALELDLIRQIVLNQRVCDSPLARLVLAHECAHLLRGG